MERLRGRHFLFDPLDRTGPQPEHLGDPKYAYALLKLFSSLALQGYVDLGPSEPDLHADEKSIAVRSRNFR
jgi:hypothetical protein